MFASTSDGLRRFADHLLHLAGWAPKRRAKRGDNPITSDFLYLKNPNDGEFYGFQFNIDFFAAAGDGRWWHDHRFPGGIGFTANSTGHMRHFRDSLQKPGSDHGESALKQAMITIAQAHTKAASDKEAAAVRQARKRKAGPPGCADLDEEGKPLVDRLACPVQNMPKQLHGKDWTKYLRLSAYRPCSEGRVLRRQGQPDHQAWAAYPRFHLPLRSDAGRFRQFHPRQALLKGRCLCQHAALSFWPRLAARVARPRRRQPRLKKACR